MRQPKVKSRPSLAVSGNRVEQPKEPGVAGHAGGRSLQEAEYQPPVESLQGGHALQQALRERGDREIQLHQRVPATFVHAAVVPRGSGEPPTETKTCALRAGFRGRPKRR